MYNTPQPQIYELPPFIRGDMTPMYNPFRENLEELIGYNCDPLGVPANRGNNNGSGKPCNKPVSGSDYIGHVIASVITGQKPKDKKDLKK